VLTPWLLPRSVLPSVLMTVPLTVLLRPAIADDAALVERTFAPAIEASAAGEIDWTTLRLTVASRSDRSQGAWHDRRMQEQDALDSLGPRVQSQATAIHITPTVTADDVLSSTDELSGRLNEELKSWKVTETRYHTSGGVEMTGELDLHTWLRPALLARASQAPSEGSPGDLTGLVLDARGESVPLSIAPVVLDPAGARVVALELASADALMTSAPVLYVTDPADPAAWSRAGDNPAFGRITDSRAGAWILSPDSTLGTDPRIAPLVAVGKVVVVVDSK
jgi:hypothetical protein